VNLSEKCLMHLSLARWIC